MFRTARCFHKFKVGPAGMGGIFAFFFDKDVDALIKPKFESPEYTKVIEEEPGWKRVKAMFSPDDFGHHSSELNSIMQAGFAAGFIGLVLGGVNKSKYAFNNFVDTNQASTFQSNIDAKRKLQNQIFTAFGKGGFHLGWRLALFTTYYCGFSTVISVYRGKSSVYEYIAAGFLTGFIYRLPLGPRASLVGSLVGGLLGSVAGGVTVLALRASGTTIEEVRYWQYQFKRNRIAAENVRRTQPDEQSDPEKVLKHRAAMAPDAPKILVNDEVTPHVTTNPTK